jgi:filamentous hemagglutinin family protein
MQLMINRRIRNQLLSSLIGLFLVIPGLLAAPQGGVIVGGSGNINTNTANTTTINQNSQSMVVNWSSFNVNANESVNFAQPSSSAAVLNQIQDQNPSQILGSINANGRVFLSNPNGMIFGVNSVVNVGALVATNLNISASDFMAGNYSFGASTNSAGAIINQGIIQAATGGSVALIGGSVKNEGVILANYGHIAIATGRQAIINFDGDGLLNFQIDESVLENTTGAEDAIHNSGNIIADAGQILLSANTSEGIFTNAINNEGLIKATRIENIGGVIHLSGNNGRVISSGDISATGQNGIGGEVHLLGDQVGLFDNATINASGSDGGGVVLIGGDFQGNNPEIKNAQQTYVGADASIKADAIDSGDGGKVIVWADKTTQYYGDISAQGGADSGNGGFVEVSGKQWLDFQGEVDTKSINGLNGSLLLDPTNITIQTAGTDTVESSGTAPALVTFADTTTPQNESILTVAALVTALGNGDVTVKTKSNNSDLGVADGDITVANDITWVSSQSLTLLAENNIIVNAGLSGVNGSIILTADSDDDGAGSLTSNSVITAGSIILEGNQLAINQNITSTSGDITFTGIGLTTFGQEVKVTSSGKLMSSALTGEGKLTLKSIGDMTLAVSTVKNGDFLLDTGAGLLDLGGVMTAKDVSILAGDVDITDTTIVASGTVSISDQPVGGGGIGLVATQLKKLNLSNTELLAITSTELTLKSVNGVVLEGDLNLAEMTSSLKIDANTFDSINVTNILSGGGLDFVDTNVTILGQTTIDIDGAYAMNGSMLIEGTGGVKIDAALGITMGATSSITTTNDAITLTGGSNDVNLGLLNAGTAAVSVTAFDILNNNGVFADVDSALTNIKGGSVTLVAINQIGVSSTDAITLDINENSTINLTFGAENAYINNLQNAKFINNSAGNIIVGNIFSSQIIGVGFNLGSNVDVSHAQLNEEGFANLMSDDLLVSVLGADFNELFDTGDDEIVSTIISSVPVLVEGINGWEFVAPSKRQIQDKKNQNQKKGVLYLDWL